MKNARFEVYKDEVGEWRWRLVSSNNNIFVSSEKSYKNKQDCIFNIKEQYCITPFNIVDMEPSFYGGKRGRKKKNG